MHRIALFVLALAAAAHAEEPAARVSFVTGHVTLRRSGEQATEVLKSGARLQTGDRIEASAGADAGLLIGSTVHKLSELSDARWTAGQPFESASTASSRPGGADFASLGQGRHGYGRPAPAKSTPAHADENVVMGAVSREEIARVIKHHSGELSDLYVQAQQRKPGLQGKLAVSIAVKPSGKVESARVASSQLSDPRFEAAIVETIRTWKFPKNVASWQFTYPFVFR